MTTSEIIKELNVLPNFPYIYWNPKDKKDHIVILGGQSCPQADENQDLIAGIHIAEEMQEIYEKGALDKNDKNNMAKLLKRMNNLHYFRKSGLLTLAQQENFLNELTEEQIKEISGQVTMYKLARTLYEEYY